MFTDVAEFARTIHVKEEPGAGDEQEGAAAAAAAAAAAVKQEGGSQEEENYGLGEEAMETDQPGGRLLLLDGGCAQLSWDCFDWSG